jgi:hypothetical protein
MGLVYNNKRIKKDISDIHNIDIISLNKFLLDKGDKFFGKLLYYNWCLLPDKETFQKNWMYYIEKYDKYNEDGFGKKSNLIPKEYYTKEIINSILKTDFDSNHSFTLINQYADGFAESVKGYLLDRVMYTNLLYFIKSDIPGYFELCKSLIKKNPSYIDYVPKTYDNQKLVELCALAVSIDGMILRYVRDKIDLFSNPNVIYTAIKNNTIALRFVPTSIENYYSFLKTAYTLNKRIISIDSAKEYLDDLKRDFPEDIDFIEKRINLQENKSLLKEENFNEESFVFTSDRHKIDIKSLSNFLIEKGDRVLDTLLYARGYKEIDYYSDFFREEIIKYVNSDIIKKIPKELWDDYSFCLTVSSRNGYYAIDFINEDFLNDYNIVKNLLTQQGELINKVNPDILDEKLIRLANKTNTSGKDLTDTCYFWEHYDGRYELLKKIISVYPDKIRFIRPSDSRFAVDKKYYELLKIAYLKNKNILRYKDIKYKYTPYYEKLKNEFGIKFYLKEYISKQVRKLLKEKISL